MSEEDAELKDVLVRSLNESGLLPKLQSQLRAAVFLALEKHNYAEKLPPANEAVRSLHSDPDGLIAVSLLVEFLKVMKLENTLDVLMHEAELNRISLLDKDTVDSLLNIDPDVPGPTALSRLIAGARGSSKPNGFTNGPSDSSKTAGGPQSNSSFLADHESRNDGHGDTLSVRMVSDTKASPDVPTNSVTIVDGRKSPDGPKCSSPPASNDISGASGMSASPRTGRSSPTQSSRTTGIVNAAALNSKPTASPCDLDYQDDFDSPRSQDSQGTLSTPSSRVSAAKRITKEVNGPVSNGSRLSPPKTSDSPNDQKTESSNGSGSVIRVYSKSHKRRTGDTGSDVDDEEEEIPELVKELTYSGDEDTVDQTIDSDESLHLDHVEEVDVSVKKR
ncbi:unnamed protein product [Calicophoron daubneyi]|uniref:LisH domain-containing protein n=1 Tax=Calicophoron daubneyi TaxID=300641 RepID=A0AAV2TRE4_CALDB